MNYQDAVEYIESVPRFTQKTTLEHTRQFLRLLGSPEKTMRIIHVAGTNGKGSVCAYLDGMIRANGYSCGLFTSPHLVHINERFCLNGAACSDADFLKAFEAVVRVLPEAEEEGLEHPTYFETLFLMGMVLFHEAGMQFCVLETGMGGRLDATNAVEKPVASVITSIGMDHMKYLGNTIGEIAGEKAGIIKPGIPVIYDDTRAEASEVILRQAGKMRTEAIPVGREQLSSFKRTGPEINTAETAADWGIEFRYVRESGDSYVLKIHNIARCQMMNAAIAFETMKQISGSGQILLTDDLLKQGMAEAFWPCRMEAVRPDVIVDGAHNEDGIRELIRTVQEIRNGRNLILLFGALSDHEHEKMAKMITGGLHPEYVIITQPESSRAADADEVEKEFRKAGCMDTESIRDQKEACRSASALLENDLRGGLLVCAGSLYLAGTERDFFKQQR